VDGVRGRVGIGEGKRGGGVDKCSEKRGVGVREGGGIRLQK